MRRSTLLKRKDFWPWTQDRIADWLKDNKDKIQVESAEETTYEPLTEAKICGKHTTYYYRDILND